MKFGDVWLGLILFLAFYFILTNVDAVNAFLLRSIAA